MSSIVTKKVATARPGGPPLALAPAVMITLTPENSPRPEGAPTALGRPYTVVYDGNCKVCHNFARLLRTWDRNEMLEITTSQTPGVQARFPWIPAKAYLESVQLIGPGGETWQGALSLEQILDILPKGRLISWLFSIPLARPLAERFYRWFARNRAKFGCGEHCAREEDVRHE